VTVALTLLVVLLIILASVIVLAVRLAGGIAQLRLEYKLWRWRARVTELKQAIRALDGDADGVEPEGVYREIDRAYPGTVEAKLEQLEAERDYYQARIRAIERDRGSAVVDAIPVLESEGD